LHWNAEDAVNVEASAMNGVELEALMSLLDGKFSAEVLRFVREHKERIREQLDRGERVAVPTSSGTVYLANAAPIEFPTQPSIDTAPTGVE
jgi:hypothetical protein